MMNSLKKRFACGMLRQALEVMPVVVVTGARQTGKTTLVRELCPGDDRTFYSLDQIEIQQQFRSTPESLLKHLPTTIDEVQRIPELLLTIKTMVDSGPRRPGAYLLTGSANLSLLSNVADSLAGRAYYLELHPFCPVEWCDLPERLSCIDSLFRRNFDCREWPCDRGDWIEWAIRGGFPSALSQENDQARDIWFSGYVQTYLERDLREIQQVSSLPDFRRMMRLAAARVGRLLNQSEIGRDAGIKQPTAHRYLNLLETGYQIARLDPYATKRTSQIVKSKKLFWRDTGLGAWLNRYRTRDDLEQAPDIGFWLEQAFFQTLAVWASLDPSRRHLYYWRDRRGNEVDFILENDGDLVALEIKTAEKVGPRDAAGLNSFKESLKGRKELLINSAVLHTGTSSRPFGDNVYALPIGYFFPDYEV